MSLSISISDPELESSSILVRFLGPAMVSETSDSLRTLLADSWTDLLSGKRQGLNRR
jgi:hypothetical protein